MQIVNLGRSGNPIYLEIPDEVIDAAMKVHRWMSEMEYSHGFQNIKLYGLTKAKEGE